MHGAAWRSALGTEELPVYQTLEEYSSFYSYLNFSVNLTVLFSVRALKINTLLSVKFIPVHLL
jgi:hypothetical protein